MPRVHVVPHGGGLWQVKHEDEEHAISTHTTAGQAQRAAKSHAHEHGDPEVILHRRDGRIRDSDMVERTHEMSPSALRLRG